MFLLVDLWDFPLDLGFGDGKKALKMENDQMTAHFHSF